MDKEYRKYTETPGAVLIDLRAPEDYREGHIPGSINLSLTQLADVADYAEDLTTPIFVYCYSGNRSRQAAGILSVMGYTDITDMGGIEDYTGKTET